MLLADVHFYLFSLFIFRTILLKIEWGVKGILDRFPIQECHIPTQANAIQYCQYATKSVASTY